MITAMEDYLSLRRDWERIRSDNGEDNFYYSFDWYEAVCRFGAEPYFSLFVLLIKDDDRIVAILPCWIIKKRPRFITHKSLEFIGNIYSACRGGMVLKGKEQEVADAAVDFILSKRKLWDIAYLEFLPSKDPLLLALERSFERKSVITRKVEQYANIIVDVDPGQCAEDYWNSRKKSFRQNVRTSLNRLNREGKPRILLTGNPDQPLDVAMDHYEDIYRYSWKEAEGNPLFHRKLAAYLLSKGKLRLFTLYFKKGESKPAGDGFLPVWEGDAALCISEGYVPISTVFCVVNGAYAGILKTAYRNDFERYSPGTILTWHVIQWLLDRDKTTLIDYQRDGDAYKYKWGRFRDMHMLLKAASPSSPWAMLETLGEKILIPLLRRIGWMKTPDFSAISKPDSCEVKGTHPIGARR
jgi:CelD/BcsL family acetyltransferase involved in cellulose biosynthesis